ncbi:hypothetical protein I548_2485 [Mycobacterium intracellulare]|nr:hypothetical protein I548_2485 [Mycobacterium intracellulare]
MNTPPIVTAQEWASAHRELLEEEKKLTRARDALAARRRRMPWMEVDSDYRFEGPGARSTWRVCSAAGANSSSTARSTGPTSTAGPSAVAGAAR